MKLFLTPVAHCVYWIPQLHYAITAATRSFLKAIRILLKDVYSNT